MNESNPLKMCIVLLLFHLLLSSINGKGMLIQVADSNATVCPTDEAVFLCSSNDGFLNWDIYTGTSKTSKTSRHFYFDARFTEPLVKSLGSSVIRDRLIFYNRSFFNGTITITSASNLNGAEILCNGENVRLTLPTAISYNFSIAKFELISRSAIHDTGTFNFNFELSPILSTMIVYGILVSPPLPQFGPNKLSTNSTTAVILHNNIQYSITIFLEACPESFNETFVFGNCSFFPSSSSITVVKYVINSSGGFFVIINCTQQDHEETKTFECENGKWNASNISLCGSPATTDKSTKNPMYSREDTLTTTYYIVDTTVYNDSTQFSATIMLVIAISITICGVSAIFLGILGISLAINNVQKKYKNKRSSPANSTASSMQADHIYEELDLDEEKIPSCDLTVNVAYEQFSIIKPKAV